MGFRSRLFLTTTVLTLAFAGCHCPPRRRDAGDGAVPLSVRGKPFVLGHEHAVNDAMWLADGTLLGASEHELYVLTPDSGAVRRVALDKPADGLWGSAGGAHFIVAHGTAAVEGATLDVYDAATLKVVNHFDRAGVYAVQGERGVIVTCKRDACTNSVVELARPDPLFSFETPGAKEAAPNIVDFSPDGRFIAVYGIVETHVFDVTTGKLLLKRRAQRTSEGGWRQDLFALRDDRVVMSSGQGFEAIALPSGKTIAKMPDPFAGEGMVDFAVDPAGKHVSIYAPRIETQVTWSPDETPALGPKTKVPEDAWEPPNAMATPHFARVEHPKCRIVETATKRVVFEHVALCGSNAVIHSKPGFRRDEKYFGVLYEGSLYALDIAFGHLAGMGELPSPRPTSLDRLVIDDGVPRVKREGGPLWLTRRPPPPSTLPPMPPNGSRVQTATHRFEVTENRTERTVVAFDRAGKEVLREKLPVFDTTVQASDGIAFVRVAGGDYLRCEVGRGCKPAPLNGFVASFDDPWVLLGQRQGDSEPERLVNLVTNEKRPLPPHCRAFGSTVFRDGPSVLCAGGPNKPSEILNADGSTTPFALPESAPRNTTLVGRVGSQLYFAGVVNAGLAPAYRYDMRTRDVVRIHLGAASAIAELADGTIERFGSDAATQSLRCLEGNDLLPWMECRAAYEVEGRFDGERGD